MTVVPASPRIVLVRHGRSAHPQSGWMDVAGLRAWRIAYDAADLAPGQTPPADVASLAATADVLVASDMLRARSSVALLAPGAPVLTTPLLREIEFETETHRLPALGGLRLPLLAWATLHGARWATAALRGRPRPGVDAAVLARADEAAAWLARLADERGTVVAVTHASFRGLVTEVLARRGWRGPRRRHLREWSAWALERNGR